MLFNVVKEQILPNRTGACRPYQGKIIITGVKGLPVGLALGNLKLAGLKSGFVVPSQENSSANVYDILSFLPSVPSSLMK